MLQKKKYEYLQIIIFLLSILVFYLNYHFRDYLASGSQIDFKSFFYKNIQYFKTNFSDSIINYGKLGDANWPLSYIFHAYLNPFSNNIDLYLLSSSLIGFSTFIVLIRILKNLNFSSLESCSLASLILLLPWFNGRAHWGTSANLGWFFLVITFYFYNNLQNDILKNKKINNITFFLVTFFSSVSLYTRLAFSFFCIFFALNFFSSKELLKNKLILTLYYLILSIPGWILIYIWNGIYDFNNTKWDIDKQNFKNIIKNVPIICNYFFFYLWPIFLFELSQLRAKFFFNKQKLYIVILIFVYLVLILFNNFEYLSEYTYGGGVILKFGYLLKDTKNIIFLITSLFGAIFIIELIKENPKNNLLLFSLIFIIFGHSFYLYQDYFEPLIFLLFFCNIIKHNKKKLLKKNFNMLIIIYFFYFLLYNLGTIIYKFNI